MANNVEMVKQYLFLINFELMQNISISVIVYNAVMYSTVYPSYSMRSININKLTNSHMQRQKLDQQRQKT